MGRLQPPPQSFTPVAISNYCLQWTPFTLPPQLECAVMLHSLLISADISARSLQPCSHEDVGVQHEIFKSNVFRKKGVSGPATGATSNATSDSYFPLNGSRRLDLIRRSPWHDAGAVEGPCACVFFRF
ncbi:hypothetical protein MHYP_G00212880 [Metynnis hypsauchen]